MKCPHTICYSSKSDPSMEETDIQDLFDQVTVNNRNLGLTGILLHSFGTFFQVLEGERDQVERMFTERIMNDPRHTQIFEIFNRPSPSVIFGGYSSLFTAVTTKGQLDGVQKYLGSHGYDPTAEKVSRLIMPFVLFGGD